MKANLSLFLLLVLCSILFIINISFASPRLHWVEKQLDESKKTYLYFDVHEEIGMARMSVKLTGSNPNGIKADIYSIDGELYETDLPDYGVLEVQGATNGTDYILQTPFLFWAPGETGTKTVLIKILDDKIFEGDGVEWFNLHLAPHCEGKRTADECACVSTCEDHSEDFEIIGASDRTIWVVERADAANEVSSDLNRDGLIDLIDRNILIKGWKKAEFNDAEKEKAAGLTAFTVDWSSTETLP